MAWADQHRVATIEPNRSATDYAYLAGVLDGDGHFALTDSHAVVVLCMADVQVLKWVHRRFGGMLSSYWKDEHMARPRRMWAISRAADQAALLPCVIPYLTLKRREGEVLLEWARLSAARTAFRFTPELRAERMRLARQMLDERAARKLPQP